MEEVYATKAEFQELKSDLFRMDQKMDALMEMVKKLSTKESASGVRDREAEKANSATVTVAEERPTIDDEVLSQFSDSGESKQLEIADQFKTPGLFVGDRKKPARKESGLFIDDEQRRLASLEVDSKEKSLIKCYKKLLSEELGEHLFTMLPKLIQVCHAAYRNYSSNVVPLINLYHGPQQQHRGGVLKTLSEYFSESEEFNFPIEGIKNQRLTVLNKLRNRKISVVTEDFILLKTKRVKVNSVLHDTGASDHNYISPELYQSVFSFLYDSGASDHNHISPESYHSVFSFLSSENLRHVTGAFTLGGGTNMLLIETDIKWLVKIWDPGGLSFISKLSLFMPKVTAPHIRFLRRVCKNCDNTFIETHHVFYTSSRVRAS
jgi:hypothetical protein